MTLRTASSVIFPDKVRGISGTAMIFAGTCRGVAFDADGLADSLA